MGFVRSVIGISALTVAGYYLLKAGELTDSEKWISIAIILVFSLAWIMMGAKKPNARMQKTMVNPEPSPASQESEPENDLDIPEPVTESDMDGASLRERKIAKIQAAEDEKEALLLAVVEQKEDSEENIVEVTLEMEDVHVADEFVVEVSPESVENADIESSISNRRIKHDQIRQKIELRRRGQLADIRASTARMWEEQTAGEDLVTLLQTPGHGQAVLVSPEHPESGHIYGATFIRIDETRILKLRTALDDGFEKVQVQKEPELPELLGPDGNPLPPLVGLDGVPLALPPLVPSASDALAKLKEEMND